MNGHGPELEEVEMTHFKDRHNAASLRRLQKSPRNQRFMGEQKPCPIWFRAGQRAIRYSGHSLMCADHHT